MNIKQFKGNSPSVFKEFWYVFLVNDYTINVRMKNNFRFKECSPSKERTILIKQ